MAPYAAVMAAAQAIVAAQALQAHANSNAQAQSLTDTAADKAKKTADTPKYKTPQVSNLSPLLTQKQFFSFCGTVIEGSITDSKHFAYISVLGGQLNVEMGKTLPQKPDSGSSSLPMVNQQTAAMQQM